MYPTKVQHTISYKGNKENKRPGTESTVKVPKKFCAKKHCSLYKKYGGAYTTLA
jgi:hypothetical protein